jgi:two-component system, LuxR family, response regulator FixJ
MPGQTVYVVDDDDAVRGSLEALLLAKGYAVKTFGSAEEFLAAYTAGTPGCALFDLRMPGMDGLALLEQLRGKGATLPVVMVTGHGDVPLAVRAMKAGASDFVEKPYTSEIILDVVVRALNSSKTGFADIDTAAVSSRAAALTPRERDVLEQLVIGHPNKIIAFELKISPRTVEIHRANLMKKMHADSLSHLVRMALAAGIGPKTP